MPLHAKLNDTEYSEVVDEMNRILADPKFGSSQRCVRLLRRLIEHALAGTPENFKERTLGVEVFKRDANYDTNADPVVRMAASEIRRRLAQYYQDPDHQRVVAIRLHPGSYLTEFDFSGRWEDASKHPVELQDHSTSIEKAASPLILGGPVAPIPPNAPRSLWRSRRLWSAGLLLAVGALYLFFPDLFQWNKYSPWKLLSDYHRYSFWKPLVDSPAPVILCIADVNPSDGTRIAAHDLPAGRSAAPTIPPAENQDTGQNLQINFLNAIAAHHVALALRGFGETTKLHPASKLTPPDFRYQSSVFIGGLDNPWSVSKLSKLRYSLGSDPVTGDHWIQDAQNPSGRVWMEAGNGGKIQNDYAVIARYFDQETRKWDFVLGGLSPYGTEAASDLMTDTTLSHLVPSVVRSGKNVEIVLQTHIVNDTIGTPEVLAVYSW